MKRIIYTLSIAAIVTVSACKKDSTVQAPAVKKTTTPTTTTGTTTTDDQPQTPVTPNQPTPISTAQLLGTWKVIGSMISAGGPMYFVPATGNDAVNFNSDGTMSGSAFPDFVAYMLKSDKRTVSMTKVDANSYQDFLCTISNDTLTMSPGAPAAACIEGCAIKLVKQ